MDRNLSSHINDDRLILTVDKLPPFDLVLRMYISKYFSKLNRHMFPNTKWKWLVFVIEVLHFIVSGLIFTAGLFLPPQYLPWNILIITLIIVLWQVFGYCFVTKCVSYLTNEDDDNGINGHLGTYGDDKCSRFIIPFSENFLKLYGIFVIGLSIFFHLKPAYAPFNILKYVALAIWGILGRYLF